MIKSFKHQGLERFYRNGSRSGVVLHHTHELQAILQCLDRAKKSNDIALNGIQLKPLAGDLSDYYSLEMLPSWHIIFRFDEGHVADINYVNLPMPRSARGH